MGEIQHYNDIIKEGMRAKNISVEELVEETDIVHEYLNAILNRNFDKLPPMPYVRGYLRTISEVLDLDFDLLWEEFINEDKIKKSGKKDLMPANRYEPKKTRRSIIIIPITIIGLIIFLITTSSIFTGKTSLEITTPSSEEMVYMSDRFTIKGNVGDNKSKVLINGTEVLTNSEGNFEKEVYLERGINNFEITAKRLLGKPAVKNITITYNEIEEDFNTPTSTSTDIENENIIN